MAIAPTTEQPPTLTDLDFNMAFNRLVELAKSLYPWLDLESRADVVRLHLEAMSHISGHFHYYLNRLGRGSRWGTATERSHLISLLKIVGYRPRTATAAVVTQRFTLESVAVADVVFPIGTIVRTEDVANPIRFQLMEQVTIPAGSTVGTGTVEHSESKTETYLSAGTPFQRFRMGSSPYIDSTMTCETSLGPWSEVSNFLRSASNDRHFATAIDSQERVTITFGNGKTGAVPIGPITFSYRIGGGIAGRLPAGALSVLDGNTSDANGNAVSVVVTNPLSTDGGNDRESDAEIKVNAPASTEVSSRAVSRSDYEREAMQISGVAFALMLTRNEEAAVLENEGFLFIVPDDGTDASIELLTAVASRFGDNVAVGSSGVYVTIAEGATPKTCTFQLRVRSAAYKTIDLYAKAFVRKGANKNTVRAAIESAFAAYFSPIVSAQSIGLDVDGNVKNPRLNFGFYLQDIDGIPTGHFPISDIETMVTTTPGVRELGDGPVDLTLNGLPRNVALERYQFPKAGTVLLVLE